MSRPIVLIHGYSDDGASLETWRDHLGAAGHDLRAVHLSQYVSLSNELTIRDLAEGLDRALAIQSGLSEDEEFDAIVHSTGMLVIREWLVAYARRKRRLKHLIGLAPATFGSPMAHKGRSWLGAIFKGGKELGPDFLEAGDQILRGLELGSTYTWELAEKDLITEKPVYGPDGDTPFPFIFVGLEDYGWLKRLATEEGTDGTVRWSGVGFDCRKIVLDLRPERSREGPAVTVGPWANATVPLVFLDGLNHSTILRKPSDALVSLVVDALEVEGGEAYEAWRTAAREISDAALTANDAGRWQQLLLRARDERGDPIRDYYVELGRLHDGRFLPFDEGGYDPVKPDRRKILDVHTFADDPSMRNVHVDLDALAAEPDAGLHLRIIASSGTQLVSYVGAESEKVTKNEVTGKWDAMVDLGDGLKGVDGGRVTFFFPYTTTLVEITLNREPTPLAGRNDVFWFLPRKD